MALNLWKTGGGASSYNPLPTPWTVKVSVNIASYVITFNASSNSNATLLLRLDGEQSKDTLVALSPIKKAYSFTLNSGKTQPLWLFDYYSKGDIVIDSINLVQAPLPSLTINGVDGFLSGKWNFSALGVDYPTLQTTDSTVQFTPSGTYRNCHVDFVAGPNTYTVSFVIGTYGGYGQVGWIDSNGVYTTINDGIGLASTGLYSKIFTAPIGTVKLRLYFYNHSSGSLNVPYIFSNPIISLGSNPAPYSKKTGSTMVMPTIQKNVMSVNGKTFVANTGNMTGNQTQSIIQENIPVLPSTTYTISLNKDPNFTGLHVFAQKRTTTATTHNALYSDIVGNGQGRELSFDGPGSSYTFTTYSTETFISVTTGNFAGGFTVNSTYTNMQIEQGAMATSFSQYATQVNKSPKRYVTKGKNLIKPSSVITDNSNVVINSTNDATGSITYSRASSFTSGNDFCGFWVDVVPNSSYRLTWTGTSVPFWVYTDHFFGNALLTNGNTSSVINSGNYDRLLIGFYTLNYDSVTPSNNTYTLNNIQMEMNTNQTSFVPYNGGLPQSNTGLWLNSTMSNNNVDYVDFQNVTNSYQNLDITIDMELMSATANWPMVLGQSDMGSTSGGWYIYQIQNSKKIGFGILNGLTKSECNTTFDVIGRHTIRCVIDYVNKMQYIYVDGVSSASRSFVDMTSNTYPLRLATRNGGNLATNTTNMKAYSFSIYEYYTRRKLIAVDFTNSQSIIGNTVFPTPTPQNLLPSFEDPRWIISSGAKIMGKDTLHLDAGAAYYQSNVKQLPIVGGATYLFSVNSLSPNARIIYYTKDLQGNTVDSLNVACQGSTLSKIVTFGSNAAFLTYTLDNTVAGSFDWYKPQLYLLDGKQGTINGSPIPLLKPSKRTLYNKR